MGQPKATLKAVTQLASSRGWAYIIEVMEKEIVGAAMTMANNPAMSVEEMHFRRGSIWTAKQLLELPQKLQAHLESEIALEATDLGDATASPDIFNSPPRLGEGVENG